MRREGEKRGEHMRDCVQGPQAHLYNGNSQDKWTESFKSCMRGGAGGGGGGVTGQVWVAAAHLDDGNSLTA